MAKATKKKAAPKKASNKKAARPATKKTAPKKAAKKAAPKKPIKKAATKKQAKKAAPKKALKKAAKKSSPKKSRKGEGGKRARHRVACASRCKNGDVKKRPFSPFLRRRSSSPPVVASFRTDGGRTTQSRPAPYPAFSRNIAAPGPSGRPSMTQIASSTVQTTRNATEYGSIVATSVPIPAFAS